MPKIPNVLDYGARPSLRSNRVDQVYPEGVGIAESVAKAADVFATHLGQKKQKDSRLAYAMAKNEIMSLDIAQREGLKDRNDWEAFDKDYTGSFNTGRDEILARNKKLSGEDRALLLSESDLIRERGRVHAGDLARKYEIDQGRATIMAGLDAAVEQINLADPSEQNGLMVQALETVKAAEEEEGWFNAEESVELMQGFVSKTSFNALENMETADMIREIELSLAHRTARGPIDPEDIAKGGGSGSIADFLHSHQLKKMLEEGQEEHKNSTQYGTVYDILDAVELEYPGTDAADIKAREDLALSMLDKDDPEYGEIRRKMRIEMKERNANMVAAENRADSEKLLEATNAINVHVAKNPDLPLTLGDVRQLDIYSKLSAAGRARLEQHAQDVIERDGYALGDDDDFVFAWKTMSREDKIAMIPKFDSAEVKTQLTRDTWDDYLEEAVLEERAASNPGSIKPYRGDAQDEILENILVGEKGLFKRAYTGASVGPEANRYRRIDAAVDRGLKAESRRKINEGGNGELTPEEIYDVTLKIASQEIFVRTGAWSDRKGLAAEVMRFDVVQVDGRDRAINVELDKSAKEAFIPIADWGSLPSDVPRQNPQDGQTANLSRKEYMLKLAGDGANPSNKDLEEAYFYLISLPEDDGIAYATRRLAGEKGL